MSTAIIEDPAVHAGTYDVDPVHSRIGFAVKHLGINVVRGTFTRFEATIQILEASGGLTVAGVIDAASVDTGFVQRDEHLRTGDFFDVADNPTIAFTSTGITRPGRAPSRSPATSPSAAPPGPSSSTSRSWAARRISTATSAWA